MRPIVSFCGSRVTNCPNTWLSYWTLWPTNHDTNYHDYSRLKTLLTQTKTVQVPDGYKLMSFDVKVHQYSTSIGSRLHWDRHQQLYCWTTTTYRPLNGLTEPLSYFYSVSVQRQALQTRCMVQLYGLTSFPPCKNIEERALSTYKRTLPLWLSHVDDTFTIDDCHEHLDRQNADIQFAKEIEENTKRPFLDCLVTRDNYKLRTTTYRKPTHTDLLDQSNVKTVLLTKQRLYGLWQGARN